MKKVALVSCYFKHNYGSMLQAFALQEVLLKNGVQCENINISNLKDFSKGKKKYYKQNFLNLKLVKAKLGMVKLVVKKKLFKGKLSNNLKIRDKAFEAFKTNFNLSKKFATYKELSEECNTRYSDVIVGADQLWLPVNVVADYYTLNFVPENVNKISYSTSIGISSIPKKYKNLYGSFLKRINHLSVREEKASQIIKDNFSIDAKCVCDPTILMSGDEWLKFSNGERKIQEEYIFCYFLGKSKWHRKFAETLAKQTNCKIVSINHCDEYVKCSEKFADYAPYDVNPFEWINLIKHAKYVCTDSFHGTVFSILLHKDFFTFSRFKSNSTMSTNSRIQSLLEKYDLQERWLFENTDYISILNKGIDYDQVDEKLQKYREESKQFLFSSLTYKKEKINTVEQFDKFECCGCGACEQKCPVNAISMLTDNEGFLYPSIDKIKCVNCGLCVKTCPVFNVEKETKTEQKAFLVQNLDKEILMQSTSGGAFSALAEVVIEKGGVVFGAGFDDNFDVAHTYVENKADLSKFRNSKYVQSKIGNCYKQVKDFLAEGREVLFSGTPCQVEGLYHFLGKNKPENLYLIDVVCRSVPSPKMWQKYKEFVSKNKQENIKYASFRDKYKYGYAYSQMCLQISDKKKQNGVDSDSYLRGFFKDLSIRPTCFECSFKKRYRVSDLTIWDCFDVYRFDKQFDDNRGVTRVLKQSLKGKHLIEQIKNCKVKEISADSAVYKVNELVSPVKSNANRKQFFIDMNGMSTEQFFKKWFPDSFKVKTERFIRHTSERLGIYRPLKRIARKILGKE